MADEYGLCQVTLSIHILLSSSEAFSGVPTAKKINNALSRRWKKIPKPIQPDLVGDCIIILV